MLLVTYTFTQSVRKSIDQIDRIRTKILLTPIFPKTELRLRWEAMIERIYWSLTLNGRPIQRSTISDLLTTPNTQSLNKDQQEVLDYKNAFNFLNSNWLSSQETITHKTILDLYNTAFVKSYGSQTDYPVLKDSIQSFLDYLQKGKDHPVIQSAIAFIQLLYIFPFKEVTEKTARLLAYLFLYKYYFDIRGLFVLEKEWQRNFNQYNNTYKSAISTKNITLWLEFYCECAVHQLEDIEQNINLSHLFSGISDLFWTLNDRQKKILTLVEVPDVNITNRKVQKAYKVSQITASRDLAKLTTLGLLFPHGKGRSTYYTKV